MPFVEVLEQLPLRELSAFAQEASAHDVARALSKTSRDVWDFAALLSPVAASRLEDLARASHSLTLRRFGRTVHMYAPLYLSNECLTTCTYCGFARGLPIARKTLSVEQTAHEAEFLRARGFR